MPKNKVLKRLIKPRITEENLRQNLWYLFSNNILSKEIKKLQKIMCTISKYLNISKNILHFKNKG